MRKDPIIEEIHKFREAHARKFNYDLDAIFDDLQQKHAVYWIRRPAKT